MKRGKGNLGAQDQLVSKKNAHDHGDGFEQPRKIVVKETDDASDMGNISKHEEPLSPMACLNADALFDSYILIIVGFKNEIDVKSLKILLQNNLAKHQRFSSVAVKDTHNNLKWCPTEVVIEDHVIVPCLSLSTVEDPNFINEYTSSLVTAPSFNPSRPLWEVHVLNVCSGDTKASLVFRIHHSLGDCTSMISLAINSTSQAADANVSPTIRQHKSSDQKSTGFLQFFYNMVLGLWLTFLSMLQYGATLVWKQDRNLLTEENRAKISKKRLAHVTLSIEDICLVKNAVNGDLDKNMENPSKVMWGNKVGFWIFPFPAIHYEDPLQYCRDITMISRRKKLSSEAYLSNALDKLMPTKLVAYLVSILFARTTLVLSNVLGPVEEIQLGDNPITHIIPTTQINYVSIMIHFMSYAGKGKLVALVSEDVIPNPQQLCEDCADALQVMKEAEAKTTPLNLS
ncbi:wax ester synthase/diacylglycerol acyltransferase 7 isoform X2 [Cryptomeria japonica]|uniref:wax ester synthase/diacylglycerol acyltransferase 7 isoform X2 n=1 Tax=Cryptomeria japonica TaxID=3369 RepID=UPI0027DAA59C|nr:wax ester synthase/diacylglycerol acyltransferase 7 isoform X2 [Cryptomeria japonica]